MVVKSPTKTQRRAAAISTSKSQNPKQSQTGQAELFEEFSSSGTTSQVSAIPTLADADLTYLPYFLAQNEADELLKALLTEIPFQEAEIQLFGRRVKIPRLQSWHGGTNASYTYSGTHFTPQEWTPSLLALKHRVEEQAQTTFNSVLCNWYRDGQDSMGWHSDDEPELGRNPVIASVTLGEMRTFKLRHKFHKHLKFELPLAHGSLLIMAGKTQHFWQHHIAKTKKPMAGRLNLTFRKII